MKLNTLPLKTQWVLCSALLPVPPSRLRWRRLGWRCTPRSAWCPWQLHPVCSPSGLRVALLGMHRAKLDRTAILLHIRTTLPRQRFFTCAFIVCAFYPRKTQHSRKEKIKKGSWKAIISAKMKGRSRGVEEFRHVIRLSDELTSCVCEDSGYELLGRLGQVILHLV